VDTNIVFSAILNTESKIGDLLMNSERLLDFHSCQYLRLEIHKHRERLMDISGLTEDEFEEAKNHIFSRLKFHSEEIIPYEYWEEALLLVREVDVDDIAFVTLSNYLDANLWTGDKLLMHHLRFQKGYEKCLSTAELFEIREGLRLKL
jgi:predicted nucleic acid-binding protein